MKTWIRAVMVTVWLGVLSGCVAAVAGGAAVGGYYAGKDERSVGQITEDAGITSSINTRYVQDDLVQARLINVDTYNGVVTLYGDVPNQSVADRAIEIARGVKGVRRVDSKLTIGKQ